jgi:hypothetical protein
MVRRLALALLFVTLGGLPSPVLARCRKCRPCPTPTTVTTTSTSSSTSLTTTTTSSRSTTTSSSRTTTSRTSTTTTATTTTVPAAGCELKMVPLLVCAGAADYDNWAMSMPQVPICAGQVIGCNIFFTNASHCDTHPLLDLGIVWAGLTLDWVVDGVVPPAACRPQQMPPCLRSTGQTFPTQGILADPEGAGYEAYPLTPADIAAGRTANGELCSTVIPDCTIGLSTFDPITLASDVGRQVSIRATYIVREQAHRNDPDGGIRTVVTTSAPITVVNCP